MAESATTAIREALSVPSRPFVGADEGLHPAPTDDPMWAETSWWAFTAPDDGVMGWVYMLFRSNLGTAAIGVWIWDASSAEPRELLHSKSFVHVPLDATVDLRRLRFAAPYPQVELDVVKDLEQYRLAYVDGHECTLQLDIAGVCPPVGLGISEDSGHADQPLWASGTIEVAGRRICVDDAAFRDRTWSLRPELPTAGANCYTWGTSRDLAFQHLSMLGDDGRPTFTGGLLLLDSESSSVVRMERSVVERRADGCPSRLELTVCDAAGRELHAVGECTAAAALPGFAGFLTWATLVRWQVGSQVVWGEDHDSWPHEQWCRLRRSGDPRVR